MNFVKDNDHDSFYQQIKACTYFYLDKIECIEKYDLISLLDKLRNLKKWHGSNHPSLPGILQRIVNLFDHFNLSQFSILFLLEQLRVEKFYLGFQNLDLVHTLCKIGNFFSNNNQLLEAEAYFSEGFSILNHHNKRGRVYADIIYNLGMIKHHKCLFVDASIAFDLALEEQRATVGEMHPDVAEMCLNIGDMQVEVGKLDNAVDKYLEALIILRVTHGNRYFKVCKILYKIGVIHKIRGEYDDGLNAFNQALDIARNEMNEVEFLIVILNEMSQIYQHKEDVRNVINIFEEIINIIKLKLGGRHACVAIVLQLLRNIYKENGMIENSDITTQEIQDIFVNPSNQEHWDDFSDTLIELFGYPLDDSIELVAAAAA